MCNLNPFPESATNPEPQFRMVVWKYDPTSGRDGKIERNFSSVEEALDFFTETYKNSRCSITIFNREWDLVLSVDGELLKKVPEEAM